MPRASAHEEVPSDFCFPLPVGTTGQVLSTLGISPVFVLVRGMSAVLCSGNAQTEGTMPDLFETMENCRAMRRLKPDPVPDELISKILQAGACAPNGGNTQRWRFLVIKDRRSRKLCRAGTRRPSTRSSGRAIAPVAPPPGVSRGDYHRQHPPWNT